ncbi:MAG: helix-turn-helix transcriptional regulator [Candidatus Parcubacteria bacterium]|nr:helix-turn-helix transcriptional regulator [Candidatus Parcubacteria bacterium]
MDSPKDLKNLGQKIKVAREKKKMTQAEVAEKAGMNTNYYAVIERGEINPSYETLKKIAEALGIKSLTF